MWFVATPCCVPCLLAFPLPRNSRAGQLQQELRARIMQQLPEASYKIYGWLSGNLALFVWQPPRPDLVEGEEDEDNLPQKVEAVILGSSMEAMQARLEQSKLFDEKKSYYGAPRGWLLTFTAGLAEPIVWTMPLFYFVVQITCMVASGESLAGYLSGELDMLQRPNGTAFLINLCSSAAMWILAMLPRNRNHVWSQGASGLLLLLFWMLVAAPSSVVLAFGEGVGVAQYGHLPSLIFCVVLADSTVFASYFFYRAWRITKVAYADKVQLHETAMLAGLLFSLITTMIHIFCVAELLGHTALKAFNAGLPETWKGSRFWFGLLQTAADVVLEPHRVRAYVALMTGVYLLMCFDGPRASLLQEGFKMRETAASNFFGNKGMGRLERFLWRIRLPAYVLIRWVVTSGFTVDPDMRTRVTSAELPL